MSRSPLPLLWRAGSSATPPAALTEGPQGPLLRLSLCPSGKGTKGTFLPGQKNRSSYPPFWGSCRLPADWDKWCSAAPSPQWEQQHPGPCVPWQGNSCGWAAAVRSSSTGFLPGQALLLLLRPEHLPPPAPPLATWSLSRQGSFWKLHVTTSSIQISRPFCH